MTTSPVTYCERHPEIETGLRCSSCETYICPRCLVYTPVGTRCPDCARLRRPPMYELAPSHYARAAGAAVAVGLALGLAGAILLPIGRAGFLGLFLALLVGAGAGAVMAASLDFATGRKRGVPVQVIAVAGVGLAVAVRLILGADFDLDAVTRDTLGWFAAVIAAITVWGRLR